MEPSHQLPEFIFFIGFQILQNNLRCTRRPVCIYKYLGKKKILSMTLTWSIQSYKPMSRSDEPVGEANILFDNNTEHQCITSLLLYVLCILSQSLPFTPIGNMWLIACICVSAFAMRHLTRHVAVEADQCLRDK